jgi:PGF-pre-PGF domain-containing protein
VTYIGQNGFGVARVVVNLNAERASPGIEVIASPVDETRKPGSSILFSAFAIDPRNFTTGDVRDVTVDFAIDKQWITQNGLDEERVTLYEVVGDAWLATPTTRTGGTEDITQYRSTSTRSGTYAILGFTEGSAPPPVPVDQPVEETPAPVDTTPIPEPGSPVMMFILIGMAVVALGISTFVMARLRARRGSTRPEKAGSSPTQSAQQPLSSPTGGDSSPATGGSKSAVRSTVASDDDPVMAYIAQMRGVGKSDADIRQGLLQAGWRETDADRFLEQAKASATKRI